jgi:hypothetical protein
VSKNSRNDDKTPRKFRHPTTVTLPVELTFDVWPAMEYQGELLPPMVDITRIELTIVGPGGKPRTIDITQTFSEDEVMALEDDIIENYTDETD